MMKKKAGKWHDFASTYIWGNHQSPQTLAGGTIGLLKQMPEQNELKKLNDNKVLDLLPGIGPHNLTRRRLLLSKKYNAGKGKAASQLFGPLTSSLALSALGALAGAGIARDIAADTKRINWRGATIGAVAGGLINPVMGLIGVLKKPRTDKQQQNYQKSTGATFANYILPGVGAYNQGRSIRKMSRLKKRASEDSKWAKILDFIGDHMNPTGMLAGYYLPEAIHSFTPDKPAPTTTERVLSALLGGSLVGAVRKSIRSRTSLADKSNY